MSNGLNYTLIVVGLVVLCFAEVVLSPRGSSSTADHTYAMLWAIPASAAAAAGYLGILINRRKP
jgi:hypothetical protein